MVTIAVVVNVLAAEPALRWRFDATKTRAYSLSAQTRRLLAELDGQWTIALVLDRGAMDPAVLRQVVPSASSGSLRVRRARSSRRDPTAVPTTRTARKLTTEKNSKPHPRRLYRPSCRGPVGAGGRTADGYERTAARGRLRLPTAGGRPPAARSQTPTSGADPRKPLVPGPRKEMKRWQPRPIPSSAPTTRCF